MGDEVFKLKENDIPKLAKKLGINPSELMKYCEENFQWMDETFVSKNKTSLN